MVASAYQQRAIVHLNVADFAVAVERQSQPGLHDRPVVIAPQGAPRARVYDMSDEAFKAGVRKHMLMDKARRVCPDAKVLASRPHRYRKAMLGFMCLTRPLSPLVECEEDTGHVFLDLSGTSRMQGPPQDVAWRLRTESRKRLGLDPIWGLAPNRLLAKAATWVVKPDGEHVITSGREEAFLKLLPLNMLPGLEMPELEAFGQYNLKYVKDALTWRQEHLAAVFGKRGAEIYDLLRGRDETPIIPVGLMPPVVKLGHEFSEDTNTVNWVERGYPPAWPQRNQRESET